MKTTECCQTLPSSILKVKGFSEGFPKFPNFAQPNKELLTTNLNKPTKRSSSTTRFRLLCIRHISVTTSIQYSLFWKAFLYDYISRFFFQKFFTNKIIEWLRNYSKWKPYWYFLLLVNLLYWRFENRCSKVKMWLRK